MAVEVSPCFIQANTYSAELARRGTLGLAVRRGGTIGSVTGGIASSTDLQITAGSGLHVEVSAGECVVAGSSSATQSGYYLRGSSTTTLTIPAANASNPRIERIVAQVKDAAYTGAENLGTIAAIEGTATSGATLGNLNGVAAAPTSSLTLGYVLVPALASSLEAADISNVAELLVPAMSTATYREGTEAARPAAGVKGRIYYATDKKFYSVDTGSEWVMTTPSHGHSTIATEETRTNTEYGKLGTPDQVEIFLPENGLILVGFQGQVKNSVGGAGRLALFLGSNQVKVREGASVVVQSAAPGAGTNFVAISTCSDGLVAGTAESPAEDVTTGQIIGATVLDEKSGLCAIFAAAGAYTLSVQYKSTSGSVTAKARKLWALAFPV